MCKERLLDIENANFGYHKDKPVITNATLTVSKGDVVLIRGESGSGKSTFAKAMTGLLRPLTGAFFLNSKVSLLANKGLGLNPELTLIENALLRYYFFCSPVSEAESAVDRVIRFAELSEFAHKPLRLLPSLLKSRFALSLYLLGRFDLIIIDEGIGVSDPKFRLKSELLIKKLLENSSAAVVFYRSNTPFLNYATSCYDLIEGSLGVSSIS